MVGGTAMHDSKTIVENAVNSVDHTTLVVAVQAAGLVETPSGGGPFTIFALTNDAFGMLAAGTVEEGMVRIEDERRRTAMVTTADVKQSNWVIHVINTVLLPAM